MRAKTIQVVVVFGIIFILAGASPTTKPATQPAKKPTSQPTKFTSVESMVKVVPEELIPKHEGEWNEFEVDLFRKWAEKFYLGKEFDIKLYLGNAGTYPSLAASFFYSPSFQENENSYVEKETFTRGHGWKLCVGGSFDQKFETTFSKLHETRSENLGSRVRIGGTVKSITVNTVDAGTGLHRGDGLYLCVQLSDCHFIK